MLLMGLLGLSGIIFVPVLLRWADPQLMATVLVAQVYVYYLVLLVQFGFNWSGPAAVARGVQSADVAAVWHASVSSKLYLLLGPVALLFGVGYIAWADGQWHLLGFGLLLIASALNSNWFLQSIQNFAGGVASAVAGVAVSVLLLLVLVNQGPSVSPWLSAVLAVGILIAPQALLGLGSWWLAKRACAVLAPLGADRLDAAQTWRLLRKDSPLVLSQLLLLASTTLGTVVVGVLADAATSAAYAATEKLFNLGATVQVGAFMALYPRFATSFYSDRAAYWLKTKQVLAAGFLVGVVGVVFLSWFGQPLMALYLSEPLAIKVAPVLNVFAIWLGLCLTQHVLTGYLVLAERHRTVLYANACVLVVTVVVGYALARIEPIHWVYGMVAGQLLACAWLLQLYLQDRRTVR
jgi:O-antigen/teichoic acid export membrane protein